MCILIIRCWKRFYFATDPQNPHSLLVLCKEGLVVFDISQVGNPQCNVPFVLDLHKSPVTSMEYVNECPDNLAKSLSSAVHSKQLVKVPKSYCTYIYVCVLCVCVSICVCMSNECVVCIYTCVQCMSI